MLPTRVRLFVAMLAFWSSAALCQNQAQTVPVPSDPLELATGPIQAVDTPEGRAAIIKLLGRARDNYRLQTAGRGYDLKVYFTVDSGGVTQYDGSWEMEDVFAPGLGLRWTATTAAGYTTTRIIANGLHYADGTADTIPLSLHEARGVLLGPMGTPAKANRQLIRTSAATLNGTQLTCVLLSGSGRAPVPESGRHWEETEECIDPRSGLLEMHSLAPARYAVYDYTNAADFHGHVLPRKVTITEAGRPVLELHVDSLKELASPDPALFVPTEQMKANGPATEMAGAIKLPLFHEPGAVTAGVMLQPVIILGLIASSGQLVDPHSLQPSDPRSEAAVEAAQALNFPVRTPPGATPQQHEVFVIESFASGQ
jgi:hypothetical protein